MAPVVRAWTRARSSDAGFALAELLGAVLMIATASVAVLSTFDHSRDLTSTAELKESAIHRAEREIERIQGMRFSELAHPAGASFSVSTDPSDPTSRIVPSPQGARFKWDRRRDDLSERLVTASRGTVQAGPTSWDDGRFSGKVHRFVTWADDAACAGLVNSPLCPNSANYKRVTTVVTIRGLKNKIRPVWSTSLVSDPRDGPVDTVSTPVTECLEGTSVADCARGLGAGVSSLFLTDTSAKHSDRQPITGSHSTHPNLAAVGLCTTVTNSGCPVPDLLEDEPLPDANPLPSLFKYSSDVSGGYTAGRAMRRDTTCSGSPTTTDNSKGGFWVTPPLTAAKTYSGEGTLSLFSHTLDGVSASVTLCMAVYDVPQSILNLLSSPPAEVGRTSYTLNPWPTNAGEVSFPFEYRGTNVSLSAGHRLGVRVWVSSGSGADIAAVYDHPSYPSYVQLNEAGS